MPAIFISYRRNDTEGEAGRLFDDLISEFGENSVFMDVSAIEAGRDFRKAIDESVATCGALLAIIGKDWVDAKDDAGRRRLDDPTDFVRLETISALRRDIPVIPVLVRSARMPRPEELPEELRELAYRNCVELTHVRWNSDLQLLVEGLRRQLKLPKSGPHPLAAGTGEDGTATQPSRVAVADVQHKQDAVAGGAGKRPDEKKRWPLVVGFTVFALALIAGAYLFFARQVSVPKVIGDTVAVATAKLAAAHLKIGQTAMRQEPNVGPDIVLAQFPASGEKVNRGTAIELIISQAAAQVTVPAVTGQGLDLAVHILSEHQLNVGDLERQSRAGVAQDIVLQQFPKANEQVKAGGKIDLLVSDVPPAQGPTASTASAGKTANDNWSAQRATQRAAEKQAALKAAADKAANEKAAADAAAAGKNTPKVIARSATCTTLAPGKYKLDISGEAYVPPGETYLFYTWASIGSNGTRWRPECKGWSTPRASNDPLWEVSCIHRPGDTSLTEWQTSRTITTQDKQPPTTGGTAIFKPGAQGSSLKFNLTCQ